MKYFYTMSITFSLAFSFLSLSAQAQSPKEAFEYSEVAKNRTYVGGPEESSLKLLPEGYFLKNKKTSGTEETSEGF